MVNFSADGACFDMDKLTQHIEGMIKRYGSRAVYTMSLKSNMSAVQLSS